MCARHYIAGSRKVSEVYYGTWRLVSWCYRQKLRSWVIDFPSSRNTVSFEATEAMGQSDIRFMGADRFSPDLRGPRRISTRERYCTAGG